VRARRRARPKRRPLRPRRHRASRRVCGYRCVQWEAGVLGARWAEDCCTADQSTLLTRLRTMDQLTISRPLLLRLQVPVAVSITGLSIPLNAAVQSLSTAAVGGPLRLSLACFVGLSIEDVTVASAAVVRSINGSLSTVELQSISPSGPANAVNEPSDCAVLEQVRRAAAIPLTAGLQSSFRRGGKDEGRGSFNSGSLSRPDTPRRLQASNDVGTWTNGSSLQVMIHACDVITLWCNALALAPISGFSCGQLCRLCCL
jgi:hypothetical protein